MKSARQQDHRARKRFGQNFLIDNYVINSIAKAISAKHDDKLVEIGPGKGAITGLLLKACPDLQVIELDRDLIPILLSQFANYPNFKIHQTDALNFDFSELCQTPSDKLRIVGNLPYNISTPLIFHLLSFQSQIKDMHFMLQKEVVQRLAARSGEKNYGRLSIMTQYYCHVEYLFDVPPECFRPAPKVDSAIVRLTPHENTPYRAMNKANLDKLVKAAFSQRRKTLRNALKSLELDNDISDIDFNFSQRAEDLSIEDFIQLSHLLWGKQANK